MGLLLNVITIHSTGQHMFSDMLSAAGFEYHQDTDLPEDGLMFAVWPYVEERYGTLDDFRLKVSENGWRYAEVILVRHPVDIFLSRVERESGLPDARERSRRYQSEIDEFFDFIKEKRKHIPTISYEDLCTSNVATFRKLLEELGVNVNKIDDALAIPHDGSVEKWLPNMRKTLRAEIKAITKVVCGDYSSHSAFSRHKHSRPAAIYLRLLMLWPPFYKNYRNLFITLYSERGGHKVEPPMKPLWKRFL